jgi:hypothetical protein
MKKVVLVLSLLWVSSYVVAQKGDEFQKQAEIIGKGLIEAIKENRYASIEKFLVTEPVVYKILSQRSEVVSADSVKKTNIFIRTNFRNKLVETIDTYKKAGIEKDITFNKVKLAETGKKPGLFYSLFINYIGKDGKKEEARLRLVKEEDKFYVVSFDK